MGNEKALNSLNIELHLEHHYIVCGGAGQATFQFCRPTPGQPGMLWQ